MGEALLIFKSITKLTEVEGILQQLLATQGPLQFKNHADETFSLKPLMLGTNLDLRCQMPDPASATVSSGAFYTASFQLNDDKYILETKIEKNDSNLSVSVKNLFHVQKRKNFRYVLPKSYIATFKFKTLSHTPIQYSCRLLDLSTEGCAVEVEFSDIKVTSSSLLEAEIILGDNAPIPVQGLIKNIREKDELRWVLGIEFNHMAAASEHRIVTAIADLQRSIFLKNAA
ncbi:MAG: PilZ domain-containing protein [Bdellovibrio sp.]|nr:PilZ domain-containing protein [Bdellovibrio sp.]